MERIEYVRCSPEFVEEMQQLRLRGDRVADAMHAVHRAVPRYPVGEERLLPALSAALSRNVFRDAAFRTDPEKVNETVAEVVLPELDITNNDVRRALIRYPSGENFSTGHARHEHTSLACRERQLLAALREIADLRMKLGGNHV